MLAKLKAVDATFPWSRTCADIERCILTKARRCQTTDPQDRGFPISDILNCLIHRPTHLHCTLHMALLDPPEHILSYILYDGYDYSAAFFRSCEAFVLDTFYQHLNRLSEALGGALGKWAHLYGRKIPTFTVAIACINCVYSDQSRLISILLILTHVYFHTGSPCGSAFTKAWCAVSLLPLRLHKQSHKQKSAPSILLADPFAQDGVFRRRETSDP